MELTILEADLCSLRKDLFATDDLVQVAISHTPIKDHHQVEQVSQHAGNIQYDQGIIKNIFWNHTFTIGQNDLSLTNSQEDKLYVCLVKNCSGMNVDGSGQNIDESMKMEIVGHCEEIRLGEYRSRSNWNSSAQVAVHDAKMEERIGNLFFSIKLPPPGSDQEQAATLKKYDMNLRMYSDGDYDGLNASSASVPLTVASLRRDDRSQTLLTQDQMDPGATLKVSK